MSRSAPTGDIADDSAGGTDGETDGDLAAAPLCSLCARAADPHRDGDPPLAWCADLVETSDGPRTRWVCPECTRRYVRSIEAKLDQQWW